MQIPFVEYPLESYVMECFFLWTKPREYKEPDTGMEAVVWVRFTVEIETNERSIKKQANNVNQHLTQINELFKKGLIDPPAVKVLEAKTCGSR